MVRSPRPSTLPGRVRWPRPGCPRRGPGPTRYVRESPRLAGLRGEAEELIDIIGLLPGDIVGLAHVVRQVECMLFERPLLVLRRGPAPTTWAAGEGVIDVGQLHLPEPIASRHGLEFVRPVVEVVRLVRTLRPGWPRQQRPDVLAVDRGAPAARPRPGGRTSAARRWSRRPRGRRCRRGSPPGQGDHGRGTPRAALPQVVPLPSRSGPAEPAWSP